MAYQLDAPQSCWKPTLFIICVYDILIVFRLG